MSRAIIFDSGKQEPQLLMKLQYCNNVYATNSYLLLKLYKLEQSFVLLCASKGSSRLLCASKCSFVFLYRVSNSFAVNLFASDASLDAMSGLICGNQPTLVGKLLTDNVSKLFLHAGI